MPRFRIYRMKEGPRTSFRWAPHVSGAATLKRRDYDEAGEIEAPGEYAAWSELKESDQPLQVGDALETEDGQLRVCKYVGFEPAQWFVPPPESPGQPGQPEVSYTAADPTHGG